MVSRTAYCVYTAVLLCQLDEDRKSSDWAADWSCNLQLEDAQNSIYGGPSSPKEQERLSKEWTGGSLTTAPRESIKPLQFNDHDPFGMLRVPLLVVGATVRRGSHSRRYMGPSNVVLVTGYTYGVRRNFFYT